MAFQRRRRSVLVVLVLALVLALVPHPRHQGVIWDVSGVGGPGMTWGDDEVSICD